MAPGFQQRPYVVRLLVRLKKLGDIVYSGGISL